MSQPQTDPLNPASGNGSSEEQRRAVAANLAAPPPPTASTSDRSPEQAPEDTTDWFRVAFANMRSQQYGSAPREDPTEAPPAFASTPPESNVFGDRSTPESETGPGDSGRHEARPTPPPSPRRRQQGSSPQEEFNRAVQSEVDRRLDKFNREEAIRRQREQELRQQQQERYLRDNDPHEYARLVREREVEQAETYKKLQDIQSFATEQVTTYDRHVLDPIFRALPEAERRDILSQIEGGIEGRGKAAQAALKTLEKMLVERGRQSARQALMQDQTFIKEILARYGGGAPEPMSNPALPSSPSYESDNMNDRLRAAAAATRRR